MARDKLIALEIKNRLVFLTIEQAKSIIAELQRKVKNELSKV